MKTQLAFAEYYGELDGIERDVESLIHQAADSGEQPLAEWLQELTGVRQVVQQNTALRLALIGEFSSGKSSLIAALTGADVKIDADVCTSNLAEYNWNGITLVDTPGIQAETTATDHDAIARKATQGADLVLFVITNELFNDRLSRHLRFILDDSGLGLATKSALLVNKMDRENNPEEELRGEITRVLEDHSIPLYFCSASKFLHANTVEAALSERFRSQSGISELIGGLNRFVDDAGTHGRLRTPLQRLTALANDIESALVSSEADASQMDILKRSRLTVQRLQGNLDELRRSAKLEAISIVNTSTAQQVDEVENITSNEAFQELFASGMEAAGLKLDSLYERLEGDIRRLLQDTNADLEAIEFGAINAAPVQIDRNHSARVDGPDATSASSNEFLRHALRNLPNQSLQQGLSNLSQNTQGMRNLVYTIGKKIGYKFRPWEATKMGARCTTWIGHGAKALPVLSAALNFWCNWREEKAHEEKANHLAQLRNSMRHAFTDQARTEAEALEKAMVSLINGPVGDTLRQIDEATHTIVRRSKANQTVTAALKSVTDRCRTLNQKLSSAGAA